jgi:hypothetical protein
MKNPIEMGASAMLYIPSLIKIGSGIQKFMGGEEIYRHTYTHIIVIS